MSIVKSVSFRDQLQSNISDMMSDAGVNCLQTVRMIVGVVSQLAAYAEEGVPLTPAVFVCDSINQLVLMMGPGEHIQLSDGVPMDRAAREILKAAAPLSSGYWNIYVERDTLGQSCKFGVFCGSTDPSSSSPDEVLFQEPDPEFLLVRVVQRGRNKVQVRCSTGAVMEFRFNDDSASVDEIADAISDLAARVVSGLPEVPTGFVELIRRLLSEAVQESHGTIVVVVPDIGAIPEALSDAVRLEPAIDLLSRYRSHLEENRTSDSVSRLQAAADLIKRLISSDGITVLDDKARVVAYRGFVKPKPDDPPASAGGARTRAFEALKVLAAENHIAGVFFRSQDGRMAYKG